jgi:hypothetical protein
VSSSLIRQDLVPMIVGYAIIMGALATGLRIVQRSGGAGAADAAGVTDAVGPDGQPNPAPVSAPAATQVPAPAAPAAAPVAVPPARDASAVTSRARRLTARPEPGWRRLVIHSLGTAVGGYLLLMAVIIAYYYGVARVAGNFVHSAFSGCAMLIGLAAPVFFILSWLAERKGWRI